MFKSKGYYATNYRIRVLDDSIVVEEVSSRKLVNWEWIKMLARSMEKGLLFTIFLEFIVAFGFCSIRKISKRVLINVVFATVVSLPLIWFTVLSWKVNMLLAEVFVILWSFVMNVLSFVGGLILVFYHLV